MRTTRSALAAFTALSLLFACSSRDVVIGDDTTVSPTDTEGGIDGATPDAPPGPDGSPPDSSPDAPAASCESILGTCQAAGTACSQKDTSGATCSKGGDYCCKTTSPVLSPPAPTFCDGGPIAPTYNAGGCVVGYACAPITCTTAGGT